MVQGEPHRKIHLLMKLKPFNNSIWLYTHSQIKDMFQSGCKEARHRLGVQPLLTFLIDL